MVEAILSGKKAQTRRVMKPQPRFTNLGLPELVQPQWRWYKAGLDYRIPEREKQSPAYFIFDKCPYGKVGDRLWVREAWSTWKSRDRMPGRDLPEDRSAISYTSTDERFPHSGRCRHARFMPRWASRITLEITSVRIERLQDITPADAAAEGCPFRPDNTWTEADMVSWYGNLWDVINGRGSWCANPWIWVIEFKPDVPTKQKTGETVDA